MSDLKDCHYQRGNLGCYVVVPEKYRLIECKLWGLWWCTNECMSECTDKQMKIG